MATMQQVREIAADSRNRFAWVATLAIELDAEVVQLRAQVERLKQYAPDEDAPIVGEPIYPKADDEHEDVAGTDDAIPQDPDTE